MTRTILLITSIVIVVLLLSDITGIKGNPSPKKRKSSSSTTSDSSSNARPASGSSGSRYNPTNWKNPIKSKPHKPKSSISKKPFSKKNFKKALAFGAGAYISYKISKKVSKKIKKSFKPFRFGGRDYDYDEWDQYARIDGWVCRNDRDCSWLDPRLGCNDYEFSINLINAPWPWKAELRGTCACEDGFQFNRDSGICEGNSGFFTAAAQLAGWAIAVIIIAILLGLCCCCGCILCVCKSMKN